jgi:hypothetical protein
MFRDRQVKILTISWVMSLSVDSNLTVWEQALFEDEAVGVFEVRDGAQLIAFACLRLEFNRSMQRVG